MLIRHHNLAEDLVILTQAPATTCELYVVAFQNKLKSLRNVMNIINKSFTQIRKI